MRNISLTLTPITQAEAQEIKGAAHNIAVSLTTTLQTELGIEAAERNLGVSLRPTLDIQTTYSPIPACSVQASINPNTQANLDLNNIPVKSIDVVIQAVTQSQAHCGDPRRNIHLELIPALILPSKSEPGEFEWSSANW